MAITKATASSIAPASKGDLVVGSATNDAAVLAVGTNNQVLTCDSAETTGLKWATPAGGATLLSTTSFGSNGFSITNISQAHKRLICIIEGLSITGDAGLALYFNNYAFGFYTTNWNNEVPHHVRTNYQSLDLTTQHFIKLNNAINVWAITIDNYTSTTGYKPVSKVGLFHTTTGSTNILTSTNLYGVYANNSPITQLDMEGAGHSYTAGTVRLFGV